MKNINKRNLFAIAGILLLIALIATSVLSNISAARRPEEIERTDTNPPPKTPEKTYNFLVAGKDRTSGLTDVLMLVSYDLEENRASIVQIPRDTYARFTEGSYRKINGAASALGDMKKLADFLSRSLCIPIDYYVRLDLDALAGIVDAVGGVEVDVPFDFEYRDPYQDLVINIPAGKQTLDGRMAEQFVRYRSGYVWGDIGRQDAQKIFLAALAKKVKESFTPITVTKIALTLISKVETDMPVDVLYKLAKAALSVEMDNIGMLTLAGESATATISGASYYVISRPSAIEIVNTHLAGNATEENFDPDRLFLNPDYDTFIGIYFGRSEYGVHDAKSINEEGIDIAAK